MDIAEALDGAGVTWWADYGTLLGAVRNPMTTWADYPWLPQKRRGTKGPHAGIIPHDKDADIGIIQRDWAKSYRALYKLRRAHGYDVATAYHRGSIKVRLSSRNHTNCDVFFWTQRRSEPVYYRRAYASVDKYKGKEFHEDMLLPLTMVEWEGMELPAPADPEAFLEMRYGPNWRTPVCANNDGVKR